MQTEPTPYQQADQILKALLTDLQGRPGFDDIWGQCARDTQKEIKATWRRIILRTLKPPPVETGH